MNGAMDIFYGIANQDQRAVAKKLSGLIESGAPGHAHLFCGPAGAGKRAYAAAFAKALLCVGDGAAPGARPGTAAGTDARIDAGTDAGTGTGAYSAKNAMPGEGPGVGAMPGESPGAGVNCRCAPCKLFDGKSLDDYFYIEPSGQGVNKIIPVGEIRRLTDWFAVRPMISRRKVCLISRADHMTEQAQNALLKTLEEPPPYGVLILTAENPGALLETARSRCETAWFSVGAGGGPNAYAYALDADMDSALRDELLALFDRHLEGDAQATFQLSALLERNAPRFSAMCSAMVGRLRGMWLSSMQNKGRYSPAAILDCMRHVDEAASQASSNANLPLAAGSALFRIKEALDARRRVSAACGGAKNEYERYKES